MSLRGLINNERTGTRIFLVVWFSYIVLSLVRCLGLDLKQLGYSSWGVSDWLINYQGGFVRRGLPGEVLHFLYSIQPFNVFNIVVITIAGSSVLLLIITTGMFIRKRWSAAILPMGCCFFFIFLGLWQRKDSFLLILTYCIFLSYRRYLRGKSVSGLLCFFVLSAIMLLSHEASFFFCFPILALYSYSFWRKSRHQLSKSASLCRFMLPFVPVLLIMSAVCLCKGSDQIPNIIWQSWDDAFLRYPDPAHSYAEIISHPGASVQALSWETLPAVKSHLRCFVVGEMPLEPWAAIIGLLMTAWMFTAYYYLVTHLNTVRVGSYPQDPSPENEISNTLLAQFVFMIPMFTMLSCDYGRTLPYWVLSTLMAVACFGKLDIGFLNRLTSRLQRPLSSVTFRRPVVYALVTFLTPLVSCYAPSFDNAYQWHCVRKLAGKVISLLL